MVVSAAARVPLAELGSAGRVPVADLRPLARGAKPNAVDGTTNTAKWHQRARSSSVQP